MLIPHPDVLCHGPPGPQSKSYATETPSQGAHEDACITGCAVHCYHASLTAFTGNTKRRKASRDHSSVQSILLFANCVNLLPKAPIIYYINFNPYPVPSTHLQRQATKDT